MHLASSGRRLLRPAAVTAGRLALGTIPAVSRRDLSAVFRMAAEALTLKPSPRLVLSELVASWGEQATDRLLVWPSNAHLARRTGLSERSLRHAFRTLADYGLLVAKDSPNGKRYPVRDRAGAIVDAYGFDLTPLYARRSEWSARVAEQKARRAEAKQAFDRLTVARRSTAEALDALAEDHPAIPRETLQARYAALVTRTPRRGPTPPPTELLDAWTDLRATVEAAYYHAGTDGRSCRHNESQIESSVEPNPPVDDPADTPDLPAVILASGEGGRRRAETASTTQPTAPERAVAPERLPFVVDDACPVVRLCGQAPVSEGDLIATGRRFRPMLGADEAVWREAETTLGAVRAATAVIYVTQLFEDDVARHGESRIRNPGGYLRAFVRMVASGSIDLTADLLAMRRRRLADPSAAPQGPAGTAGIDAARSAGRSPTHRASSSGR
ncbi:plasmid replication protein RepC [Acuticoccus sp. I52.16.1]|uniref:plasmid replication protein RepC n=1 Tax=Acuticoccus sp. I52.16.1 TaxID=2928472 RepID=UPI001FD0DC18|nr:plasmid replication protein RepC [Acuticoccus sp. I52.16.1]UOM37233.1 replication initiation protein RepC [Acuticoccus sp. I52.16.1]